MSEYIIDLSDSRYKSDGDMLCAVLSQLREPIVRCRDCEFFEHDDIADGCTQFDFNIEYMEQGFCSWGERKVDK